MPAATPNAMPIKIPSIRRLVLNQISAVAAGNSASLRNISHTLIQFSCLIPDARSPAMRQLAGKAGEIPPFVVLLGVIDSLAVGQVVCRLFPQSLAGELQRCCQLGC